MQDKERRKKAVALHYDQEQHEAPQVLAAATGRLAERILETAREHHVPIREDGALAEALSKLQPGTQIPAELYLAVAQIFAEIIRIDTKEQ